MSNRTNVGGGGASFSVLNDVEVSESEIKNFQEALDLVLNRNKALRTTQSEISNELNDRAEWLNEEAIWRRTLQEFTILSGKNPYEVKWRQWRDEDTASVVLRAYPSEPVLYQPELKINIAKLKFFSNTIPYLDEDIKQIYIEYTFLEEDGPEMESPQSIPKPQPNEFACFYFAKSFPLDLKKNFENCLGLANMIKTKNNLRISVVSEPVEDYDKPIQTCQEIGFTELDFFDLVQYEVNKDKNNYPIVDTTNHESAIGYIRIKIDGILAVRKMALTMLAPKDYNIIV